ncbi:MAG: histidinol-phosphatase [Bacteroidetes bacterium]|jgi:3',5'-nucleoside bisphosphate phosphatase|nr:histidinol-phosphatase [Bacteroidota bacterium]MBT3748414.1 histidinol-phosphatase [Bacteroidota bacterium]MBT4398753.1 histidinol-phosphatase [Bacteroidota bacterium]MBT4411700.1 histidinol-phosphatase [Bacteroidota bacterium]MBT5424640.1 histidinol-phosphatase [Bacteroidota bacterium]
MKNTRLILITLFVSLYCLPAEAQRKEISIPDIPSYLTLKCDFHMHTVFSDGTVWPNIRVLEAWQEGLDAISITDHIEYRPHKKDIQADHNRSYDLAVGAASAAGIILIKGSEITRSNPEGHYNALFLEDSNPLDTPDFFDAIQAAIDQDAFVIWNHPGWSQPNKIPVWYDIQTQLYEKGWIHGMEIVNSSSYYPLAFTWCNEKEIPILACSDVHNLIPAKNLIERGSHRAMTLVFAKEKTKESIREAMFAGRTAAYFGNNIYGKSEFLKPIFCASVAVEALSPLKDTKSIRIQMTNESDLDYELVNQEYPDGFSGPEIIKLPAHHSIIISFKNKEAVKSWAKIKILFAVSNLLLAPEESLIINLPGLNNY